MLFNKGMNVVRLRGMPLSILAGFICSALLLGPSMLRAQPDFSLILAEQSSINVEQVSFILDDSRSLELKDIRGADLDPAWQVRSGTLNLGYTNGNVWLKLPLRLDYSGTGSWLLELAYANLDEVNVWVFEGERLLATYETGDSLPFLTRPIEHRNYLFPIPSDGIQELTVYMRIASTTSLQVPLKLWRSSEFYRVDQRVQLVQGMFFGIMLVMAIYNFFIFLAIRERAYLLYVVFVMMEASYQAFHQGFTYQNLWPENSWWHSISGGIAISLTIAFAAFFSTEILELRKRSIKSCRFFDAVGATGIGLAACSLILEYSWIARVASILAIVAALGIITVGIRRWRDGFRPAKTFTMAWAAFLLGAIVFSLSKLGVVGHNVVTEYGLQIGATLEVMLLSFALGQRINDERQDKFHTKARLLDEQIRLVKSYERFVPSRFLALLGKGSITEVQLGDHVAMNMTILFSDIRAFTSLSEKMSPKENFTFLNHYLKRMEPVIDNHGGFVDKYIGDCIMALFDRCPDDALRSGIVMMKNLRVMNEEQIQLNRPIVDIGIGVNTGEMMLGTIGGTGRMEGTVISDAVNTASRIEALTKIYGTSLLMSEAVYLKLENPGDFCVRVLDRVRVKGREEPILIYEVLDALTSEERRLRLSYREQYEAAARSFWSADFKRALDAFTRCEQLAPDDLAVRLFIRRCRWHGRQEVGSDWSGAFEVADLPGELEST